MLRRNQRRAGGRGAGMGNDFHHRELPIFLRNMIVPDDNVIWWEQPDPKSFALHFDRSHMIEACVIFFSAVLAGSFAIAYSINPLIYIVFPIFLFGLFMIIQPIFRYRRARKMFYIITERYLYILDGHLSPFVPRDIKNVQWVKTGVLGNVFFSRSLKNSPWILGFVIHSIFGFGVICDARTG